jgi:hypothetical protein
MNCYLPRRIVDLESMGCGQTLVVRYDRKALTALIELAAGAACGQRKYDYRAGYFVAVLVFGSDLRILSGARVYPIRAAFTLNDNDLQLLRHSLSEEALQQERTAH